VAAATGGFSLPTRSRRWYLRRTAARLIGGKFLSRGGGYTVFLTNQEAVVSLRGFEATNAVVRLKLAGQRAATEVAGLDELPGKSNYFIGNDPRRWHTQVPTYTKVRYREVYAGIDLIYYGNQGQLEYDFVVAPGGDPRAIRLRAEGALRMRLDGNGDVVLEAGGATEVRLHKPVVYQTQPGSVRRLVECRYVMKGAHEVGFDIAAYDATKSLIIDPVLTNSRYLGGSQEDFGSAIAVDRAGNAYVTGATQSADFPTVNPLQPSLRGQESVFVAKFDATGSTLLYSTYVGGSVSDEGHGIGVDGAGKPLRNRGNPISRLPHGQSATAIAQRPSERIRS
jgi:hypothetical protein